ncbi:MAG: hypothetical protein FH749_09620 [Firmicutes bacterium]|nr:hypothetical protein [Bacillota bacterium]
MEQVLDKLSGGDLRSIGRANEVVQEIIDAPEMFGTVFEAIFAEDPVLRMRCSDVIEKVSAAHPELLQGYKDKLLKEMPAVRQKEVRWHLAQMVTYLKLGKQEKLAVMDTLLSWIENEGSKIVIVNSLQTLAEFAKQDYQLRPRVVEIIKLAAETSSPAIVSRGEQAA